jgi:hypothetical protein
MAMNTARELADLVDLHDVGVREPGHRLGLAQQPGLRLCCSPLKSDALLELS